MNHPHRLVLAASLAVLSFACIAQSSSLKQRAGFDGTMTAADQTAILFSEIELCEQRFPEFRSQAASDLARIRATRGVQDLVKSPEYVKVLPEARAFVRERHKPEDLPALCRYTLGRLKP